MRKRRRRILNNMDMNSFTDQSIKKSIIGYTLNLLNRIELNEKLLTQGIQCLPESSRIELVNTLYKYAETANDEKNHDKEAHDDAAEEIGDSAILSTVIMRLIRKKNPASRKNDVKKILIKLLNYETGKIVNRETSFDRKLNNIKNIFRLSCSDQTILRLIYFTFSISNDSLNNVFDNMNFNEFTHMASIASDLTPLEIKKSLSRSGLLVSTGIIDTIDHTGRNFISIDDSVAEYLSGISEISILEKFLKLDKGRKLNLKDFSIPAEDSLIIKDLLNNGLPCSILLYGIPGTGKTEYARSIASLCSERVYSVRYGESRGSNKNIDSESRLIALRVAINTVSENGGILIVDEADFLLNTISGFFDSGRPEKGWLNDLLDNNEARIIWITNKTGSMEDSTLRRFSYSLCFKKFDIKQRISIWNNILKKNPLKKQIPPSLIAELSGKYDLNAGSIASTLNAVKQISSGRELGPGEMKPLLENLLTKHSMLLNTDAVKGNRQAELTGKYDLSFLNTDTDISQVVRSAKRFTESDQLRSNAFNINLLLWGESGTGKTEFAKYLAAQTGMSLIIKRSSDLMNMYVGETEKLIRQAFREAEEKKSILFIDEADTFFGSRERAKASWEISHTNEFLVQMENFSGILICCTNLLEIFDTAAMRRFSWKVRFSPVLQKMRTPLYLKYFSKENSPVTPEQKTRILNIESMTPGHVKTVYQRRLLAGEEIMYHDSIIDEIEKEASYMKIGSPKRMGFGV